jgi:hypothetical protein
MKKLLALITLLALTAQTFALSIAWTPNDPGEQISSYKIYMATGTGAFAVVGTSTTASYTLPTLTPGVYRFHVTAENIWGEGPTGDILTTPGAPTKVRGSMLYVVVGGKTNSIINISNP